MSSDREHLGRLTAKRKSGDERFSRGGELLPHGLVGRKIRLEVAVEIDAIAEGGEAAVEAANPIAHEVDERRKLILCCRRVGDDQIDLGGAVGSVVFIVRRRHTAAPETGCD